MSRQRLVRLLLSLAITALFAIHAMGARSLPFIEQLERWGYDLRLIATLKGGIDKRIVIVDVDEASLAEVGHWPWPRDTLAQLLDQLFAHYQIYILGMDMVFAEAEGKSVLYELDRLATGPLSGQPGFIEAYHTLRPGLEHDRLFAEAIGRGFVVTGFSASQRPGTHGALPIPLVSPVPPDIDALPLFERYGVTGNLAEIQSAAVGGGFFDNPAFDPDGVYRGVPLVYKHANALYSSLTLSMLRAMLGDPPVELEYGDPRNSELDSIRIGEIRIPVNQQGIALVPYQGRTPAFRYVSAADVLTGRTPEEVLDNVVVILGTTAPGLYDQRTTPMQSNYPGVEVHANLLAGLMNEMQADTALHSIRHRPGWTVAYDLVLVLALGLILSLTLPWWGPASGISLVLALGAGLIGGNLYAWQTHNMVLPLAGQLLLLLTLLLFHSAYGYLIEARNKRRIGRLFGQYVPPEIVGEMSKHHSSFGIGGESREMTVLFSDVRGFTTVSEGLAPDQLTALMNAFLTPLTGVIHSHRGTIDKYMGDAIMAFWGAPLDNPAHASLAVEAALAMQSRVRELDTQFKARGWPALAIGIGLNTGHMNVGNMGSEFRMAYTVLGDAVNLGSRLEGLTKFYGVGIIVSASTQDAATGFVYRELDRVRVKGKHEPVAIFEPLGSVDSIAEERAAELDLWNRALTAYRGQNWAKALETLDRLADDRLTEIYRMRIEQLSTQTLPDDWDAVFEHQSK
ncbi:MAG: adenylate/guanylate cyclase domain-containing protein [Gammaproteobacteria bacterium]|nr:adenylate/guanylate cyclase domain-containing protein [Gammaproteobacteria bacterium]MCP5138189.1 adenylate/guanylate cyclase domain-containing protein [Gammaproteobacteria bacterium]